MNADNTGSVDVLKKRFECIQSSKKPVHGSEDRRHEKNVNKRIIKRTPAFRRDVNISRKFVDHVQAPLVVTNSIKQFNDLSSNTNKFNQTSPSDSLSYKTDNCNKKPRLNPLQNTAENQFAANHKALIHCLKKKLDYNSALGCKSKIPKKTIDHTHKTSLPAGPAPQKPPRTFAHDKQTNSDLSYKYTMESNKSTKSDPKTMLQKLEKFVTENSHTYEKKGDKLTEQDNNWKKSLKKSTLCNLAKSIEYSENQKVYDSSLQTCSTDEQNYLTTKSYCENGTEHIYDEPIFLKPNSRLSNNGIDYCHAAINDEWVCDSVKTNLHYSVSLKNQLNN